MNTISGMRRVACAAGIAAVGSLVMNCGIEKQSAPGLSGPSELATSIAMVVDPDIVARDGASTARVTLIARDANAAPIANLPVLVTLNPVNGGTLSASQVVTDGNGRAVVTYTAPSIDTLVDRVTIEATPFGSNFDNTISRRASVALLAPGAATPSFAASPASPQRFQLTTFDGSATTFGGAACHGSCTYNWSFGSEATATGEVVSYRFQQQATYVVTLSVTSPTGITTSTQHNVVVTAATLPTAAFTISPTNPRVGDTVLFNGGSSTAANGATIAEYTWDFGNGSNASGVSASTTFGSARTYTVRLTVRDSNGLTATSTQTVTVNTP
jgi:chitodextrinase